MGTFFTLGDGQLGFGSLSIRRFVVEFRGCFCWGLSMKKTLSIVAAGSLVVGLSGSAWADEAKTVPNTAPQAKAAPAGNEGSDQSVVNGADVGDFLGSGVVLDRDKMDATVDREYNKYVRLDPLKPGECPPSVNPSVEAAELAQAKKANKGKKKGFKGFIKSIGGAFTDAAGLLGFPIGPQDDDARTDKWDDM